MDGSELLSLNEHKTFQKCQDKTRLFLIVDSKTPTLIKLAIPPQMVTLRHFKQAGSLEAGRYKFYFKSNDPEFGSIREEVYEDDCCLPYEGDKIVGWAITQRNPTSSKISDQKLIDRCSPSEARSSSLESNSSTRTLKVHLHLDQFNFLGLTLISSSLQKGSRQESGLYVANIAEQSVVEQNGLIELGDRIVAINGVNLEGMSDEIAIGVIQTTVQKRGPIIIEVSRENINTSRLCSYLSTSTRNRLNPFQQTHPSVIDCTLADIHTVYQVLKRDSQSLGLKSYDWLGVSISNAFLGSSLIDWLRRNVQGFKSKKGIKKFAHELLKANLIRSPLVHKHFSERCFYALN